MLQKTVKFMQLYEQESREGHDNELASELRDAVEEEIRREDSRFFREGNPVGQQLGKPLGKMLREKPLDRFDDNREGSRGTH
jgi:hypothetical protein